MGYTQVIRNEAGEVLGIERIYDPDPADLFDALDEMDREVEVDPEVCCMLGDADGPRLFPSRRWNEAARAWVPWSLADVCNPEFAPWTCSHCGTPVADPEYFGRLELGLDWMFTYAGFDAASGVTAHAPIEVRR